MDLRKSVLVKQKNILGVSLNASLNASAYESAVEDSDNSMYYSFNNDSLKLADETVSNQDVENNSMSSEADKENTIIMRNNSLQPEDVIFGNDCAEKLIPEQHDEQQVQPVGSVSEIIYDVNKKSDEQAEQMNEESPVEVMIANEVQEETSAPVESLPQIIIDKLDSPASVTIESRPEDSPDSMVDNDLTILTPDPNENIINPFTMEIVQHKTSIVPEKRITRLSVLSKKLPQTRLYSPVLRKSLERKSKAIVKPTVRRTIYAAAAKADSSKSTGAKTPTMIPKPSVKPKVVPKVFKCPSTGCTQQFATMRTMQEHQKTHIKVPAVQSKFLCKWCDKSFQLDVALFNHQTEKCLRIPFNEKRKLLPQKEKKETDRRRTNLFTVPVPKNRSPMRKTTRSTKTSGDAMNKSGNQLNKSGILITPKRSLKCHVCQSIVPDAISLANHILNHKYSKENPTA